MFLQDPRVSLFSMVMCVSGAADLISPELTCHQKRVAFVAARLGAEMGLSLAERNDLLLAGALHDIGALSLRERLEALQFEADGLETHAEAGYLLLGQFAPFARIARLVRYHHHDWEREVALADEAEMALSHLLHLADRVAVLIEPGRHILSQASQIVAAVAEGEHKRFAPPAVAALRQLAQRESFWLDLVSLDDGMLADEFAADASLQLDLDSLTQLARMLSHIIDFRSRFTAVHSSGVAVVAGSLAESMGLSRRQCQLIRISGYLHDFGKLAVPKEILEKTGPLTLEEYAIIKSHAYYSSRLLRTVPELKLVNAWISLHHERPDGEGYPFRMSGDDLPLGAKILAVADVFTAITEDRPYRTGMEGEAALAVLADLAWRGGLDQHLVQLLTTRFSGVNALRHEAQQQALAEYRKFETAMTPFRPAAEPPLAWAAGG